MKNILLWLWQLPQHLLALILWGILRVADKVDSVKKSDDGGPRWLITTNTPSWGISLGHYILMDNHYTPKDWKHEYGHSRQSLYLGPLYLPVIGIASAVFNNLWDRLFHKKWDGKRRIKWYYSRYPEDWADRLGGVVRG